MAETNNAATDRRGHVCCYHVSAAKAVLADRERELLDLKGPCSTTGCRLHAAHSGPCDVRSVGASGAARVAENGADRQRPVERTAEVALDCGGCGDTIWPTERIYEFGDGRVHCTICQVKSSSREADQ